jgi:pantoate--beta-alanine ligase
MASVCVIRTVRELQARADEERGRGRRIALVPTMGALHEGHLSLVKLAHEVADVVVVSLFVNPKQFDDPKDFERYPADLSEDLALCEAHGVDVAFVPDVAELYPDTAASWVEVEALTDGLCGASRPGHFRGVTTVVTKLFHAARPHVAIFGEKDYQQLAVLRRMAQDLAFGIEVIGGPIVREPDGLALSSRNLRLGPRARAQALVIVQALDVAEAAVGEGERDVQRLLDRVSAIVGSADQATIDYVELRDAESLEACAGRLEVPSVLALALHFEADPDGQGESVRLIDNRVLLPRGGA